jgi:hypothetical protein
VLTRTQTELEIPVIIIGEDAVSAATEENRLAALVNVQT